MLSSTPAKINFSTLALDERPSRISHSHRSAYLESLCDYLYDDLRPRILHEPRLTALCEVCTVLQALMVLDVPAIGDEEDDDEYAYADELTLDLRSESRRPGKRGLRALHVGYLLQMVLQDAQTRLFFKAQSVIQSEIRYYVPKADDLDYPRKLLGESFVMLSAMRVCSCRDSCAEARDRF